MAAIRKVTLAASSSASTSSSGPSGERGLPSSNASSSLGLRPARASMAQVSPGPLLEARHSGAGCLANASTHVIAENKARRRQSGLGAQNPSPNGRLLLLLHNHFFLRPDSHHRR